MHKFVAHKTYIFQQLLDRIEFFETMTDILNVNLNIFYYIGLIDEYTFLYMGMLKKLSIRGQKIRDFLEKVISSIH